MSTRRQNAQNSRCSRCYGGFFHSLLVGFNILILRLISKIDSFAKLGCCCCCPCQAFAAVMLNTDLLAVSVNRIRKEIISNFYQSAAFAKKKQNTQTESNSSALGLKKNISFLATSDDETKEQNAGFTSTSQAQTI